MLEYKNNATAGNVWRDTMPIYEYEHTGEGCDQGKHFEIKQPIHSDKFTECPYCGKEVKRLISLVAVNTPKGNSDLKNLGFTKLVNSL